MESEAEVREAKIHFELYRLLVNAIKDSDFPSINYHVVHPEYLAGSKSADLVIDAKVGDKIIHFLAIEVKKKTSLGLAPFSDMAKRQAKEYASTLESPYYAVTDGHSLVLFKSPDIEVGSYRISLEEDCMRSFLKDLAEHFVGKSDSLTLPQIQPPHEKIKQLAQGFTKSLRELFDELQTNKKIIVRRHTGEDSLIYTLGISGCCKKILSLQLSLSDEKQHVVLIEFKELKSCLDFEKFAKHIRELSDIPGFRWIKAGLSQRVLKNFAWRYISDIVAEEKPDSTAVGYKLKNWILQILKSKNHSNSSV